MNIHADAERLYNSRPDVYDATSDFIDRARSLIVLGRSSDVALLKRVMMATDLATVCGVYDALSLLVGLTMSDETRMSRCLDATRESARYHAAERCVTIIAGWPVSRNVEREVGHFSGRVVSSHAMCSNGPSCRDVAERFAVGKLLVAERSRQVASLWRVSETVYRDEFMSSISVFSARLSTAKASSETVSHRDRERVRVVAEGIVIANQTYGIGDIEDAISPTEDGMAWLAS